MRVRARIAGKVVLTGLFDVSKRSEVHKQSYLTNRKWEV